MAGVDEAGRGPWAGPVTAGAVILDPARPIEGLTDSKKLSEARRDALAPMIRARAAAWSVAHASPEEIDRLKGLLNAHGINPMSEYICKCGLRRSVPAGTPPF